MYNRIKNVYTDFSLTKSQFSLTKQGGSVNVPENIHMDTPTERFWFEHPLPCWKFHFSFKLSFKKCDFN